MYLWDMHLIRKATNAPSPTLRKMFVTMDVNFFENKTFFTSHLQGENKKNEDLSIKK